MYDVLSCWKVCFHLLSKINDDDDDDDDENAEIIQC